MNNTRSQVWSNLPLYMVYSTQGLAVVTGNVLVMASILSFEALRSNKEYLIIFGLSLADGMNMAGYLFTGLYRSSLVLSGEHDTLRNAWECMLTVQNAFWSVGLTFSAMMLATVTLDRLLCVLSPLTYIGWTATYAQSLVATVFSINLLGAAYWYACTYGTDVMVQATCMPESVLAATVHPLYFWYFTRMPQVYSVLSVVLYVVVLVLYRRKNATVHPEQPQQQYELRKQRKVTITLAISALCTLFLFVLPYSIATELYGMGYYRPAVVLWSASNLNPVANLIIYPMRHKELRRAFKAMFTCKHMPADLKLWHAVPGAGGGTDNA